MVLQHLLELHSKRPLAALLHAQHLKPAGAGCALGLSFSHAVDPSKPYADGYRDDGTRVAGGRLNFPPLCMRAGAPFGTVTRVARAETV